MINQTGAHKPHRLAAYATGGESTPPFELVLVVDPDHDDSRALTQIIEDRDRHALTTSSAGEALDALECEPIDVVVLGLGERDASGFALLSTIRQRREFDEVPLLVMPAHGEPATISRVIDLGANAVLPKPLKPALVKMLLILAVEQTRRQRRAPPARG